jgi:hypothetical protein
MPRARQELLDSALTYFDGSENRLTEVFATALEVHEDFARAFFDRVDIELPDDVHFQAFTQKAVAEGARPDMVVRALQGQHLVAQLWSEHKVGGGGFRDMQLEDYRDALARERSQGRLVGIVAEVESGSEGSDWRMLTWQQVAELANSVGARWGAANGTGRDWRISALEPTAPARERVLHEFIWYIEEENEAVVNPLDSENLQAFQKAAETTLGLVALLDRAGQHMRPEFEPEEAGPDGADDGSYYWQLFTTPEGSWLSRIEAGGFEAYPELMAASDDPWSSDSRGEPAFGVGYTLDEQLYELLAADAEWLARLAHAGVDLDIYDGWVRIFCTKPMADVLGEGATLDEQARALARWAKQGLTTVGDLRPSDFDLPSKRRRRRSKDKVDGNGGTDEWFTQKVSANDIDGGLVRIPQGSAKGLFPSKAAQVEIELRGTKLSVKWDPSFARLRGRERSGRLKVDKQVLANTVKVNERLRIEQIGSYIRLS